MYLSYYSCFSMWRNPKLDVLYACMCVTLCVHPHMHKFSIYSLQGFYNVFTSGFPRWLHVTVQDPSSRLISHAWNTVDRLSSLSASTSQPPSVTFVISYSVHDAFPVTVAHLQSLIQSAALWCPLARLHSSVWLQLSLSSRWSVSWQPEKWIAD